MEEPPESKIKDSASRVEDGASDIQHPGSNNQNLTIKKQDPRSKIQDPASHIRPLRLPIVLLAGPTGVGKTSLALRLARSLGTDIVNADSMQVYRFMDIGTAKPTPEERLAVKHHLLDVVKPDEPFDAARYMDRARQVVDGLHREGKIPLVVGGTGLYMKTLTKGVCAGAPASDEVRLELFRELEVRGLPELHGELLRVDPVLGERIHPNDRQRIVRALEVYRLTGKPLSYRQEQHRFEGSPYTSIKICISRERDELYERIDRRVHLMMEQGFLGEVADLLAMGYGPELKPMQSLGYKQLVGHLSGGCSLDSAVCEIQRETRHYAKRQMTWFRGDPEFHWIRAKAEEEIIARIQGELERLSEIHVFP